MPSHISPSNDGMPEMAAGIAMARAGIEGNGDCRNCCDDRIADLKEEPNAGNESRGKRAEKAEVIRNCCMAAMVIVSDEVRAHSFVIVRGPKRAANNAPCSDEADNVAARTQ